MLKVKSVALWGLEALSLSLSSYFDCQPKSCRVESQTNEWDPLMNRYKNSLSFGIRYRKGGSTSLSARIGGEAKPSWLPSLCNTSQTAGPPIQTKQCKHQSSLTQNERKRVFLLGHGPSSKSHEECHSSPGLASESEAVARVLGKFGQHPNWVCRLFSAQLFFHSIASCNNHALILYGWLLPFNKQKRTQKWRLLAELDFRLGQPLWQ